MKQSSNNQNENPVRPLDGETLPPPMPPVGVAPPTLENIIASLETQMASFNFYAHALTPKERKHLLGAQSKNFGFISQSLASAVSNPQFTSPYLTASAFHNDVDTYELMRNLLERVRAFENIVSDTVLFFADKCYHDALAYYNYLKMLSVNHVAGAQAELYALKHFFHRTKGNTNEPTEEQVERDVRALLRGSKDGKVVVEHIAPAPVKKGKTLVEDETFRHNDVKLKIENRDER